MNSILGDLLNCCRLCLNKIDHGEIAVQIDETAKNNFFDLTGTDLIDEPEWYSNLICEQCSLKLNDFVRFRSELIECQKSLYGTKEGIYVDESSESQAQSFNYEQDSMECIVLNEPGVKNEIIEIAFYDKVEEGLNQSEKQSCNVCGQYFTTSGGLYYHMKRTHHVGKCFECDICGKLCNLKNDLVGHMRRHLHKDSRLKHPCSYCESIFLSKPALHNHFKTFHSNVIEIHPCDFENCDKNFQTRMKLLQHKSNVHEVGQFLCELCDKFYSTKHYLRKHFKQCHFPKDFENCENCGKSYSKGASMKRHILTHAERQFKCVYENCEKSFKSKSSLSKHIESQHEAIAVSCDQCGFSFPTLRHLNRHISRQHNSIKVECEVQGCKMLFGRKDYLASHYKTHKEIDEITKQMLVDRVKNIKTIPW